jgi:hypothetical protein
MNLKTLMLIGKDLDNRSNFRQQAITIIGSTITTLVITGVKPGFAQERLLPTSIAGGDCVAPNISTAKTAAHRKIDLQYCTQNNPGNSQKIQICKQNSANQKRVTFFSDRCSSKDYLIGINGVEYKLKRKGGILSSPPYLTGTFIEKGIKVQVEKVRSISKTSNDGVESGELEVLVKITQNKRTEQITGILSYGP